MSDYVRYSKRDEEFILTQVLNDPTVSRVQSVPNIQCIQPHNHKNNDGEPSLVCLPNGCFICPVCQVHSERYVFWYPEVANAKGWPQAAPDKLQAVNEKRDFSTERHLQAVYEQFDAKTVTLKEIIPLEQYPVLDLSYRKDEAHYDFLRAEHMRCGFSGKLELPNNLNFVLKQQLKLKTNLHNLLHQWCGFHVDLLHDVLARRTDIHYGWRCIGKYPLPFLVFPVVMKGRLLGKHFIAMDNQYPTFGKERVMDSLGTPLQSHVLMFYDYATQLPVFNKDKLLCIVEGVKDALTLLAHNVPAVALLGAGNWSETKLKHVLDLDLQHLIVLGDGDSTGRAMNKNIVSDVGSLVPYVSKVKFQKDKDPNDLSSAGVSKIINDCKQPEIVLNSNKYYKEVIHV